MQAISQKNFFFGSVVRVFFVAWLASACTWAAAQSTTTKTKVVPLPAEVSLSRPASLGAEALSTYAAYAVTLSNSSPNSIDRPRFTGTISAGAYHSVIGAECPDAVAGVSTTITCNLGKLGTGGGSATFYVVFTTPTSGSAMTLTWQSYNASGPDSTATESGTTSTALYGGDGTNSALQAAKSFLPGVGSNFSFFTGGGTSATASDPFVTRVLVPVGVAAGTTLSIVEDDNGSNSCFSDRLTCFGSTITIPNLFYGPDNELTIVLMRDAATIKPGAKVQTAVVEYTKDGASTIALRNCGLQKDSTVVVPLPGVPCIDSRVEYKKSDAPTPDDIGDWRFIIRAKDNGRYVG